MRSYNLLKQVAGVHNVYFLSFFLSKEEQASFKEIEKVCVWANAFWLPCAKSRLKLVIGLIMNVFSSLPFIAQKYRNKRMQKQILQILKDRNIQLVHVDILPMMTYFHLFKDYPVILIEHNIESLLLKRRLKYTHSQVIKLFWRIQYLKLLYFEKKMIAKATCCVTVSNQEKEIAQEMSRMPMVEVVPNGVDVKYFIPQDSHSNANNILFLGSLQWFPNDDGLRYFCEKIYPEIKILSGDAKIIVIGKKNTSFIYNDRINQVGFIDDVRPYMGSAAVFIVPLRIGGGTRLKILDAMAMGKAIVSTSIGCEGIEVENGTHLIIEDNPINFARAVAELLNNESKRRALGKNARKLVEEKYDWELIGKKMNKIYESIAN